MLILLLACRPDVLPTTPSCVESRQDTRSDALQDAWVAASGQVHAVGEGGAAVRATNGTWVREPALDGAWWIHGSGDTAFTLTRDGVFRREPTGGWTLVVADPPLNASALRVDGSTVQVLTDIQIPDAGTVGYTLHTWDGSVWTEEQLPSSGSGAPDEDFLPDGRPVLLTYEGLAVWDGVAWSEHEAPADAYQLFVGPDGTLLTIADASVGLGDENGVLPTDPGVQAYWFDADVRSADDVWLLGYPNAWDGEVVIVHWDGSAWTDMGTHAGGLRAIAALGDGQAMAVGGREGRLAVRIDALGLTVDDATISPTRLEALAADDVTGEAWSVGHSSLARFTDRWAAVADASLVDGGQMSSMVASDGRVAFTPANDRIVTWTGGVSDVHPLPDGLTIHAMCGAGGTLFAVGSQRVPDTADRGPVALIDTGAGWTQIELGELPLRTLTSCHADAPDVLWLGSSEVDGGAVARWDGSSATVVAQTAHNVGWIGRLADGQLWMSLARGPDGDTPSLAILDGTDVVPVANTPFDAREAAMDEQGRLYVGGYFREHGFEDPALARWSPDGALEILLTDYDYGTLVGDGGRIWAAADGGSAGWSRICAD